MTGTRICVWLRAGVMALAAAAIATSGVGARAQSQQPYPNPPGGAAPSAPASAPPSAPSVPSVNGVYQDAASNACDSKGGFSLNVGGFSPAFCKAETMETTGTDSKAPSKCFPIGGGDTFLVGQKGNTCYYCQSIPSSPYLNLNWIVVPMDAGQAAYKQGFACAMAESDSCYMTCDGSGPFDPPAGVTLMPPVNFGGTGQTQKLKGFVSTTPDACYPAGPKNYNACDYPNLPRPAGCTCPGKPAPAVKPTTKTPAAAPLQAASDFSDQMRAAAETMLQNAGRISKVMTDSMDARTHNNVGINVMLMSSLGALGKTMTFVAEQYQAIAAAKVVASATEQGAILEIAGESAAESGALASEAEQAAAQAAKAGSASPGSPAGTPMGTLSGNMVGLLPYQEGMVYLGKTFIQTTGDLPYCGVLSCARLGQLLKANASLTKAFESVQVGAEGTTPQQMVAGLQQMGINAQIATGTAAGAMMAKLLGQGKPLIAGVEIFGPGGTPAVGTSGLHAVVVEGAETIGGVQGFKIYDPAGWYYWQPIETFFKYSSGVIVHAL